MALPFSDPTDADHTSGKVLRRVLIAVSLLALLAPGTAQAQQGEYQLFDKFSIAFEGSWAVMDTTIRLDSELIGKGTELNFENDGGLDSSKALPTLSFDWRIGRRHRLGGWWANIDRDSITTILTEIKFGDVVFPIEARVRFLLGTEELGLGYTYMISLKERHAFGLGGGFRTLKTTIGLAALNIEKEEEGDFTAPLPFFSVEYRYGISPKWRLVSDFGVFYIEIGDFSGSQIVLDAYVEYLISERFAFGGGIRGSRVDADMTTEHEIAGTFNGAFKMSIMSGRLFFRVRF